MVTRSCLEQLGEVKEHDKELSDRITAAHERIKVVNEPVEDLTAAWLCNWRSLSMKSGMPLD